AASDVYKRQIQIEQDYQELIENKNKINLLYSQNKVQLKNTLELLEKNRKEYSIIEEQIKKELEEGGLEIERVEEILKNPISVEENRLKIQEFYVHYKVIQEHIAQLERKFSENSFNIDIYLKIEENFTSKEGEMKSANEICIKLDTELRQLEKSFEEKKEIIKEVEFYRQKNENIKLLDNIFRGQGFIQYISSIYMQQLCEYANERFRQMTRGQLSLQVNENNEFEVVDYLNEGKTRSVKTLSGGQAFQVSLSLALALAESVQSEAITKRNFFFIDEGFGTQDLDSVNIVFESITKLLKENRIVGIISHVEELKERIPISLTITKDIERGSLINMS
ncbi:SbcC/MukB-like Walker B domain-containing protein, partial [uncultured Capnocytophaga sp.]|uniref:SbcC/MukB-like Walker B domain-containing protein n=1 Tax=uncultured Capnocytophaga sp. TaxID=159273 RepID=UPI00260CCF49